MSLAGKVLGRGRSNNTRRRVSIFARDTTATVPPRSGRRWRNRRSGGRRGSNGDRIRLFLHRGHFSGGGGIAEEESVVVERWWRRRSRPHGAVQPFRHLFPHHFFFLGFDWLNRSIDWNSREIRFHKLSRRLEFERVGDCGNRSSLKCVSFCLLGGRRRKEKEEHIIILFIQIAPILLFLNTFYPFVFIYSSFPPPLFDELGNVDSWNWKP